MVRCFPFLLDSLPMSLPLYAYVSDLLLSPILRHRYHLGPIVSIHPVNGIQLCDRPLTSRLPIWPDTSSGHWDDHNTKIPSIFLAQQSAQP